jgi:hypothetical protein
MNLNSLERNITETFTEIVRSSLFFLEPSSQSLCVSIFHYALFFVGFYVLFFYSKPKSAVRWIFFGIILFGFIYYFIFNRCILTSIELSLCKDKNIIQNFIGYYFGTNSKGNTSSKIALAISLLVIGLVLLRDYKVI